MNRLLFIYIVIGLNVTGWMMFRAETRCWPYLGRWDIAVITASWPLLLPGLILSEERDDRPCAERKPPTPKGSAA